MLPQTYYIRANCTTMLKYSPGTDFIRASWTGRKIYCELTRPKVLTHRTSGRWR